MVRVKLLATILAQDQFLIEANKFIGNKSTIQIFLKLLIKFSIRTNVPWQNCFFSQILHNPLYKPVSTESLKLESKKEGGICVSSKVLDKTGDNIAPNQVS